MMPVVICIILLQTDSSKGFSWAATWSQSYGKYTSLAKEEQVDSLFPLWTSGFGGRAEAEIKWRSLVAQLGYDGCSERPWGSHWLGDSLRYVTDFGILRGHIGWVLNVHKLISIRPAIGYAITWENLSLRTKDDKSYRQLWFFEKGLSYGCDATIRLAEPHWTSPWYYIFFWHGCCIGGLRQREGKERELVGTPNAKIKSGLYLNLSYTSLIHNEKNLMEKFGLSIILRDPPLDCIIGTNLHLKNGKFKWRETLYIGVAAKHSLGRNRK
jgi:hypothetical protein